MSASLRKVRPGDPLVIPAASYNAFVDAAFDLRNRQRTTGRDAVPETRQTGIVLVRNDSGADRGRFDVLGIAGPIIAPADNVEAFQERIAVVGVLPAAEHAGRFVILLEPLRAGALGKAVIAGAAIARVRMLDESHPCADVEPGESSHLVSAAAGAAGLLWVQPPEQRPDPDIAWAIVRMGGSAGELRLVRVVQNGGDAGSLTTRCTYTYDLYDALPHEGEAPFATQVEYVGPRTPVGWYDPAPPLSFGTAFRDPVTGAWRLLHCAEVEQLDPCSENGGAK